MKMSTRSKSLLVGIFFGLLIVVGMWTFAGSPGHISNYLSFVLGAFFFYLLLVRKFRSIWLGLLGSLLLALIPNLFAQSFHFSTDVAFMTTFIISTYLAVLFSEHKQTWLAVLTALASAFLIDMKFVGFLFPILLIDVFFLNGYKKEDRKVLWLYLTLTAIFTLSIFLVFGHSSFVNSSSLPWFYFLRWVTTTTPAAYLILAFFGIWFFIYSVPEATREELFVGGWLVVPLVLGTLTRSYFLNIWGQAFFLYPAILYFAIFAIAKSSPRVRAALLMLLAINVGFILFFAPEVLPNLTPGI